MPKKGSLVGKDELEILAKLPWKKLLVSNGIAGIIGAVSLVIYFHNFVFTKDEAESLKAEVHAIRRDMTELMLHLVPKRADTAKAWYETH